MGRYEAADLKRNHPGLDEQGEQEHAIGDRLRRDREEEILGLDAALILRSRVAHGHDETLQKEGAPQVSSVDELCFLVSFLAQQEKRLRLALKCRELKNHTERHQRTPGSSIRHPTMPAPRPTQRYANEGSAEIRGQSSSFPGTAIVGSKALCGQIYEGLCVVRKKR